MLRSASEYGEQVTNKARLAYQRRGSKSRKDEGDNQQ